MIVNRLAVDLYSGDNVESFAAARAAGIELVIHKATEGGAFKDKAYAARKPQVLAAGMLFGAYHFGNGAPVETQVKNFLATVGNDPAARLVLDWEQESMTVAMARDFLRLVDEATGRKTILYTYASFIAERLSTTADAFFGSHPLWIAAYGPTPPKLQVSWDQYLLWQFSDGASGPEPRKVPGISGAGGQVDVNHFDGTAEDLRLSWATDTQAPEVAQPAPPTAVRGDPAVFAYQTKLKAMEFDLGPAGADGIPGKDTDAALKAYAIAGLSK